MMGDRLIIGAFVFASAIVAFGFGEWDAATYIVLVAVGMEIARQGGVEDR